MTVSPGKVSATLFAALFAAQSALIVMSPVLAQAASDLHVSTAAAGQLRTVTGLAAGITAITLGALVRRVALGRQLVAASVLLGAASLMSAAAPGYTVLALAQVPVGIAVAVIATAATLAAAEWVPPEARTRTLSWALVGQPAAWIVGMPLIGVVSAHDWRYGWLALPLLAAVASTLLVARNAPPAAAPITTSRVAAVLSDRAVSRWLASELLANGAWSGALVYTGALFVESNGTSTTETGVLLAVGAAAYVAGNLFCRRLVRHEPRRVLTLLAVVLAVGDLAYLGAHCDTATRTVLFSATAFIAGGRVLVSNAFALAMPAERRAAATSLRAATMQFGYFVGASAGGAAIAAGGYPALGVVIAALFLASAVLLVLPVPRRRTIALALGR
jgi:MFS transporter, DHA1 family, inner membrane transport protein